MKIANYKIIGDICTIKADDFQGIFEALADGYPLLAVFYPGQNFADLEYCCVYSPPTVDEVVKCHLTHPDNKHEAHMVILLGPACKNGLIGFFFLNNHGQIWCPRYMVEDGAKKGGVGKLNAKGLLWNPVKFCYLGVDGGPRRLKNETEKNENLRWSISLLKGT